MIQKLPTHGFFWKEEEDFTPEKMDKLVKKYKRGYLLEVDVGYPWELHENHNELPFLAEKMKIGRKEKLVPNLSDKTNVGITCTMKNICITNQKTESGIKAWLKIKKGTSGYWVSTQ